MNTSKTLKPVTVSSDGKTYTFASGGWVDSSFITIGEAEASKLDNILVKTVFPSLAFDQQVAIIKAAENAGRLAFEEKLLLKTIDDSFAQVQLEETQDENNSATSHLKRAGLYLATLVSITRRQGQAEAAVRHFNKYIKMIPSKLRISEFLSSAYTAVGRAYLELNMIDKASEAAHNAQLCADCCPSSQDKHSHEEYIAALRRDIKNAKH